MQALSKRWQIVLLAGLTGLWLVCAPVAGIGAVASPIVFDRPGSLLNPLVWLVFVMMITFWIVCIGAPYIAWVFFQRRQTRYAWTAISVPALWVGLIAVLFNVLPR